MFWTSNLTSDTKFIGIHDNVLYIGNPKPAALDTLITEFKYYNTTPSGAMGIPFHYLQSIRLYEGENKIKIEFREESTEEIIISDPTRKEEVFAYLRDTIPSLQYYVESYTKLRAGKKPLIAMAVIIAAFIWFYSPAYGFEHGKSFDVEGERTLLQKRWHGKNFNPGQQSGSASNQKSILPHYGSLSNKKQ